MKQILQNLKNGETIIENVPVPSVLPGHLLIQTSKTLISAGTERMLVDFGKANLIDKARQQPDKVKQVLQKVKTDGVVPTLQTVKNKLEQPLPLGYCNAGKVIQVGSDVQGYSVGDRVVSNGKHAEYVVVPKNLCAKIPDSVSDESAVFTIIGAIALQGIRLAKPTLGEAFVVIGLGLIGLITVQLLRANGCRVLGLDYDSEKLKLAKTYGADTVNLKVGEDPIDAAKQFSNNLGVDGVIITASTKSNEPVHQAAVMCRKRGRIILVGVTGLELSRADFYEKELSFQVSCSYGPGRYDSEYEEKGHDYPLAYIRWTEQRNFQAILSLLSEEKLNAIDLISHQFSIEQAMDAYEVVSNDNPLGIIIKYSDDEKFNNIKRTVLLNHVKPTIGKKVNIGFIGAGNYATQVLIPAFVKTDSSLVSIASNTGSSAVYAAKKYSILEATTDTKSLIKNNAINTIVITTRHNNHAELLCESLKMGKHVFVEKPLAITRQQLLNIEKIYSGYTDKAPIIMVGFNRRFSPQVQKIKQLLKNKREPKSIIMTINAGDIPIEHWTQDLSVGGGRIIGEACHFIDLLRYLTDAPIESIQTVSLGNSMNREVVDDKVTLTLKFEDGSFGTVHYLANGSKSFPKERLDIFCGGSILQLDNFRKLKGYGWPNFNKYNLTSQDKGNSACADAFVHAIKSGSHSPIPFNELIEVTAATFTAMEQIS